MLQMRKKALLIGAAGLVGLGAYLGWRYMRSSHLASTVRDISIALDEGVLLTIHDE